MQSHLNADHFRNYPASARKLAIENIALLRQLPLSFLPSLLRELVEYDFMFPVERASFDREVSTLRQLTPQESLTWFQDFRSIHLLPAAERMEWVARPAAFTDQLSAYLWSTHQMDAFRGAATSYGDRLKAGIPRQVLPTPRLGIAIVGQGVEAYDAPVFSKLREHGTYFSRINPAEGFKQLLAASARRAEAHPVPYGHWYVDGGEGASQHPALTNVSYAALAPVRDRLLRAIEADVARPGMGPEELHSRMAALTPADLGMHGDPVLDRFQVKLLTEGSGTQIFSTTFAQWAAREVLRRAEALTVLVRFTPRQRERPMSELLSSKPEPLALDPLGSLIDGEMGAYYHWINQARLSNPERSGFIVWFEGHDKAVAIGPTMPRGTESSSRLNLDQLVALTMQ